MTYDYGAFSLKLHFILQDSCEWSCYVFFLDFSLFVCVRAGVFTLKDFLWLKIHRFLSSFANLDIILGPLIQADYFTICITFCVTNNFILCKIINTIILCNTVQKRSFSLRISSVNVIKSSVSCGFGHIYRRNP